MKNNNLKTIDTLRERELHFNKRERAITLIALILTIVVLIILAGVLINISLGNNGLFNKAKTAKEMYTNAQDYEETEIAKMTNQIDGYVGYSRTGTPRRVVLFDGSTHEDGNITVAGEDNANAKRTLSQNVNDFDMVSVVIAEHGVPDLNITVMLDRVSFNKRSSYWIPWTTSKDTLSMNIFIVKIDTTNNQIIAIQNGANAAEIEKVIGYKF